MSEPTYGYAKTLTGVSFDEAIDKVTAALKEHGFGVLSDIDVKATLKKKIDVDFRPYRILGACNPKLAHKALSAEPHLGLLLPCNVVVQQADEGVEVSFIKPREMFSVVKTEGLEPVMEEVDGTLRKVMDDLG
ncbi:MAG: DUF302 domain-containing protein [Myxococcota bacterium]